MGKIYNIVLNSAFGTVVTVGDVRNIQYFYDWMRLPEGRYKLTFNFLSSQFTTSNSTVCNIYTDLCQTNTFFAGAPYSTQADQVTLRSSAYQYLGIVRPSGLGANNWLYAPNNFNAEIYLNGRPSNNNFSVLLLNNDTTKSAYSATTLPGNYTLVLTLENLE